MFSWLTDEKQRLSCDKIRDTTVVVVVEIFFGGTAVKMRLDFKVFTKFIAPNASLKSAFGAKFLH